MIVIIILLSIIALNSFFELYEKYFKFKELFRKKFKYSTYHDFDSPNIDRDFWFDTKD